MKRFYEAVSVEATPGGAAGGWRVLLDGRPVKTAHGARQVVPTRALANAMAREWRMQGAQLDPAALRLRDLADYAIDVIAPDPAAAVAAILRFAESDTLCYRADPDAPLHARQQMLWEPPLQAVEMRHGVHFARVSGIIHRPQPPETLAKLRDVLAAFGPFTLAALNTLASLAASLAIALAALEPDTDAEALWAAANCEEDWQAEQWGWEWTAEERRARRLAEFADASRFARLTLAG